MRSPFLAALLAAASPGAATDPPGTAALRLKVAETYSIEAPPGSNVLCDDLAVVAPEFAPDDKGFVLRAKAPGETLCGVWLAEAKPGGLYRITVAEDAPDGGSAARDGGVGAADAGTGGDGGVDAGRDR